LKKWSKNFNIPLPECNKCGTCCNCASPSASYLKLLEKAASGEDFARDFFSIFVPYKNMEEIKDLYSNIIEKSIKASEDVVFYKCRYYSEEKQCLIYEDRPALCRDFPGSPYAILGENCAYYNWAQECKQKYKDLKLELENLKKYKKELNNLKYQQKAIKLNNQLKQIPEEYKFMWLCPSMSLVSPGFSWLKIY
jgi:Fe-S-cluster containining protein